ncbi:MAG TPA: hypothetical protein VGL38_07420 [bacterium]|jgi:hypothetical protein
MRYGLLFLLPLLLILACKDKVTDPGDGGGGGGENPLTSSRGLMPLAVGNWWDYRYSTSADTVVDFRRMVRAKRTLNQSEYYVLVDSTIGGAVDTVGYMRNDHDGGVMMLNFPADSSTVEDTLFKYPHVNSGNYYHFNQDCVLVLYDFPGGPWSHNGSLIHAMVYQQFAISLPGHSRTFVLREDSLGILSQTSGGPANRSFALVAYRVVM